MVRRERSIQMSLLASPTTATSAAKRAGTRTAAEFFAGIGLVRMALETAGIEVAWANDIEPIKARLYANNFDPDDYLLGDVRNVIGDDIPDIDLATASFPCTDLSLAGWRRGLAGEQSGMFWEFARVLEEMDHRRPPVVLLENVPGFATSHGGQDLFAAVKKLNDLDYTCDLIQLDATRFVPQSRARLFIIGSKVRLHNRPTEIDWMRPQRLIDFATNHPELDLQAAHVEPPIPVDLRLSEVVERLRPANQAWWEQERLAAFQQSLSPVQADRLAEMIGGKRLSWRTAYRRTRAGVATWEIRADEIAGCLRTARGGSSKQAVVEAGNGQVRVRWMTAREYARLQGAPDTFEFGTMSANQVMFGFGDGVCVPVVSWVANNILNPLLDECDQ